MCSTAFLTLGRSQAAALGMPRLPIVVIPHPFGNRDREEVRRIAAACAADIAKLLSGESAREQ